MVQLDKKEYYICVNSVQVQFFIWFEKNCVVFILMRATGLPFATFSGHNGNSAISSVLSCAHNITTRKTRAFRLSHFTHCSWSRERWVTAMRSACIRAPRQECTRRIMNFSSIFLCASQMIIAISRNVCNSKMVHEFLKNISLPFSYIHIFYKF